jgi:serpin B
MLKGDKVELSVANALWGHQQEPFRPEFVTRLERHFGAGMRRVDFGRPADAAGAINGWVDKETRGRIPTLIDPAAIDARTRLILTNAVYFKGAWLDEFVVHQTRPEKFTLAGGGEVQAPMMTRTGDYRYFGDASLQALELPYAGEGLAMLVILPRKPNGLPALEKSLTAAALTEWTSKLQSRSVDVHLPRFQMKTEYTLGRALAAMGMADAFDAQRADFSPMNGKRNLFIGLVVHKAFVDVNEKGTEASAATGIGMVTSSMPMSPEVFRADHPFLFMIRDRQTGAILFMGRVADPRS